MPYIKPEGREKFEEIVRTVRLTSIADPGELNYLVTKVIHAYLSQHKGRYQYYNDVIGALEGAKLEAYRRKVAEYEDEKIRENGDVF